VISIWPLPAFRLATVIEMAWPEKAWLSPEPPSTLTET
jgi:hypothetical protein